MHVSALELVDFRSYPALSLSLPAGAVTFVGANGQGKTNLVEAVAYLATLGSHRVATDAPLVHDQASSAVVRATVVRDGRQLLLEVEIAPGRSNRARINRSPLARPRELLGILRTVVFAPEDIVLVRGEPDLRRRFLDDLAAQRTPRLAGVQADYDRVLRQRNALLRSASSARGASRPDLEVLDTWDAHLAATGAQVIAARLGLVDVLRPHLRASYDALVDEPANLEVTYRCSALSADATLVTDSATTAPSDDWADALAEALRRARDDELARGVTLVGPHRDELLLVLGGRPVKGYASHGESWSTALALRLGSLELLRADGDDPVLILDDVFAELDASRRARLAARVASAEQVLVTAAVAEDVPAALHGARYTVSEGTVTRAGH